MTDKQLVEKLEKSLVELYKSMEESWGTDRQKWPEYYNGRYDGYEACINAFKRGASR